MCSSYIALGEDIAHPQVIGTGRIVEVRLLAGFQDVHQILLLRTATRRTLLEIAMLLLQTLPLRL